MMTVLEFIAQGYILLVSLMFMLLTLKAFWIMASVALKAWTKMLHEKMDVKPTDRLSDWSDDY